MSRKGRLALSILSLVCGGVCAALGQGTTAFTYQGQLTDGGSPATGNYDLQFVLLDAASGGNALAATNLAPVHVTSGLFTVTLDFGGTALDGSARWLQVAVRTNGSTGLYTTLTPRQPVTAAPQAIVAQRLSGPLPRQKLPLWRLPAVLLDWQFAPAWPRLAALGACAAVGFFIGIAGIDRGIDGFNLASNGAGFGSVVFEPEALTGAQP